MTLLQSIYAQFGNPHGFWGNIAGKIMSANNRERNYWTLELLEIEPQHAVLEVGFGPGIAVKRASELASLGSVFGIDHSETMLKQATARNKAAIREGRVELMLRSVQDLPQENRFDRIYSVNSMQFWPEPVERLRSLRALLKPGGRIAITQQPRNPGATNEDTRKVAKKVTGLLTDAGFSNIREHWKEMKPVAVVCVTAETEATPPE